MCLPDQQRIYGVARMEEARVVCRVEAYPAPNNFRWAFNNTEELVDVDAARYKNSTRHTQSVLKYRPVTEMDYGMVLCWASNTAGTQKTACAFRIIPAGTYRTKQRNITNKYPIKFYSIKVHEFPEYRVVKRVSSAGPEFTQYSRIREAREKK